MMNKSCLLSLLLMTFIAPLWADDAVEAVGTSGIVFEKTKDILMQDETLTISKLSKSFFEKHYNIDVDFHFKNISNNDISRKIAFVLPPVQCGSAKDSNWKGLENTNVRMKGLKDFTVIVDGKTLKFNKRTEAVVDKRNVTEELNKLKIPLNPCLIKFANDGKVDPIYRDELQEKGLLTKDGAPAWTENTYFEWTQTFPAGKVVHIQHHYTPIIGSSVPSLYSIDNLNRWFTDAVPALTPHWTHDLLSLTKTHPEIIGKNTTSNNNDNSTRFCLMPDWVLYHLTTGAIWNGGIGVFKLVINDAGGSPFAINEFYKNSDDVKVSSTANSTTYTAHNFVPTQDLMVMFISLPQNKKDLQACGIGQ